MRPSDWPLHPNLLFSTSAALYVQNNSASAAHAIHSSTLTFSAFGFFHLRKMLMIPETIAFRLHLITPPPPPPPPHLPPPCLSSLATAPLPTSLPALATMPSSSATRSS